MRTITEPTRTSVRPPRNTPTEMNAGRVECCPLVSHLEYVPRALKKTDAVVTVS